MAILEIWKGVQFTPTPPRKTTFKNQTIFKDPALLGLMIASVSQ